LAGEAASRQTVCAVACELAESGQSSDGADTVNFIDCDAGADWN